LVILYHLSPKVIFEEKPRLTMHGVLRSEADTVWQ
jgi:hypothetical protein